MSISQPSAICIVCHNAIFLLHHTIYLFFSVTERLLVTVNGVNSNDYFLFFHFIHMQFMKGSCCSDISRLTHKRALIFLRKYCKYLIKFQTFCQIECRNCKTFLKACAVSVQIRQTFFISNPFSPRISFRRSHICSAFFLCTLGQPLLFHILLRRVSEFLQSLPLA